jgi:hypothetical protein
LQDAAIGLRLFQAFDTVEHQVDAGRQHQLVVSDLRASSQADGLLRDVDGGDHVAHDRHPMLAQAMWSLGKPARRAMASPWTAIPSSSGDGPHAAAQSGAGNLRRTPSALRTSVPNICEC